MLQNLTVKDFIDELASKSPAPGGGSIAALSASLASSLASMVFNLTVGKKEYMEYEEKLKKDIDESLENVGILKEEFLKFMERDTNAFLSLMEAFKMPKNTDEEIKARKQKIAEGNKESLEIPLEVANRAYGIYDYIYIAVKYGNKNALSDAGVAASLTETAVEGAILNVKINIMGLKDEAYKKDLRDKCNVLLENSKKRKEEIMIIIENKLI
ncbi:methenyltetrahydrofolate cyclohydrolase [Clostridium carboxidivorans P7]|uniref:Formiminotransferase-cyclodeaminase n=1 Tax=Clostridium carboxidivorans P7 TaxID=536227 RepID=C6PNH9_9CLOT|nr:cyclodeaminase/cyclohydrolase family protein [Clostridium carboxidivorans]AKN33541.1 methenyltetrahydrofolate cyclohydrolase [Clostridium carboxidivorans P7]EET89300.1 Formiminotransferase-cyclodeaminase [Clostridium carboxidivorans P7]EFG86878.1 putative methenyltetrahydrofolate cyclohydrolase [Clostridium carboxidivorans P7]